MTASQADTTAAVRSEIRSWRVAGHVQFAEAALREVQARLGVNWPVISQALTVLAAEGVIEAAGAGRYTIR